MNRQREHLQAIQQLDVSFQQQLQNFKQYGEVNPPTNAIGETEIPSSSSSSSRRGKLVCLLLTGLQFQYLLSIYLSIHYLFTYYINTYIGTRRKGSRKKTRTLDQVDLTQLNRNNSELEQFLKVTHQPLIYIHPIYIFFHCISTSIMSIAV